MTVPTFYLDGGRTTNCRHVHYQTSTCTTYTHIPMICRVWRSSQVHISTENSENESGSEWHLGAIEINDRCMELSHWPKFRPKQPTYITAGGRVGGYSDRVVKVRWSCTDWLRLTSDVYWGCILLLSCGRRWLPHLYVIIYRANTEQAILCTTWI